MLCRYCNSAGCEEDCMDYCIVCGEELAPIFEGQEEIDMCQKCMNESEE